MDWITRSSCRFALAFVVGAWTVSIAADGARADVVFEEDFNGYSTNPGFPNHPNDMGAHYTIFGVPTQAAGADSDLWLAARFEEPENNPIATDVGVLRYASGGPWGPFGNPAGRVDDDAGLVLRLDLRDYDAVELAYDWRTYKTESHDRLVAAYYLGDGLGTPGNVYDWFNDPALGAGDMSAADPTGLANTWYVNNWVELVRDTSPYGFQHESGLVIPGGSVTYLAFWLDNGDHDLGKVDNISIIGSPSPVPEPSSAALFSVAAGGLWIAWMFRRGRAL